ncbi:hypothetical protein PW52_00740 [Tamlana sedimentorum]|uniref:DUF547 domain-containing protein n=1 Tax=Neotamlana sedimentorum TaxID=1435349 RepID=A0A0D7WD64_9FLAO|nr:DUF547 domain-containing protein [Tamlana sedimentorum]KJD37019.1 hypothetical protein PW52_00740 [Tamlana sedimentorum]
MKQLTIICIGLIFIACSGTKSTSEASKKTTTKVIEKTPEAVIDSALTNKPIIIVDSFKTAENNTKQTPSKTTQSNLPLNLHNAWDALLQKHVTVVGNVNYDGFKTDEKLLNNYIKSLQAIYSTNEFSSFSKNQKLAFWINAYNAFTIDLILRNYPVKSIKDIKNPWDERLWKLEEKWFNLNDIEHNILRKMDEPRIHFAIVCASISCPKLQNQAFKTSNLNEQLTNATQQFLTDSSKNQISENTLKLSKIFKWFAKDFKTDDSNLIDFLNTYSQVKIAPNATKSYLDYNWNLNK